MSINIDERLRVDLRVLAGTIVSDPPPRHVLEIRTRPRRRFLIGAAIGLAIAGGGTGLVVSLTQYTPAGVSTTPDGTPAPSIEPNFPTNAAGQTYGDPDPRVAVTDYPDLLLVQATNGKIGYIDRHLLDELTGGNVASPAEALEWQRHRDTADPGTIYIPAYQSDGITVIGEFPIG